MLKGRQMGEAGSELQLSPFSLPSSLDGSSMSGLEESLGNGSDHMMELTYLQSDLRNARIGQTMQAMEIGRLRNELELSQSARAGDRSDIGRLQAELAQARKGRSEMDAEISRLRRELDSAGESQTELGAEIACLRGELQSAGEAQGEQAKELMRLRRELEFVNAAKAEQAAELARLRGLLDRMNSLNFVQLEDYAIKALQVELKAEARRGVNGPDNVLMDAPEEYMGCRQFFQSGFCHFGRGRRPCPNEGSHYCLKCGRAHGTAPHLILLRRIGDNSLNNPN